MPKGGRAWVTILMLPGTGILVKPSSPPTSVCLLVIRGQKQLPQDQMNLVMQGGSLIWRPAPAW